MKDADGDRQGCGILTQLSFMSEDKYACFIIVFDFFVFGLLRKECSSYTASSARTNMHLLEVLGDFIGKNDTV